MRRGDLPSLAGEEHVCEACPFDFAATSVDDAARTVGAVPAQARALVAVTDDAPWRVRPREGVWSAAEYLCHLRDVYATFTIRLHRARTEDDPELEPMLSDLRARRFGYLDAALGPALDQLADHVAGFLAEIARTPDEGWDRVVHRLPDERRTARWLARQAAHEGTHHLRDMAALITPAS